MIDIYDTWIEISCPKCKYKFSIQLIDAKLESHIYCDNCKNKIELKDTDSSVYNSTKGINNALSELDQTLNNLFK